MGGGVGNFQLEEFFFLGGGVGLQAKPAAIFFSRYICYCMQNIFGELFVMPPGFFLNDLFCRFFFWFLDSLPITFLMDCSTSIFQKR